MEMTDEQSEIMHRGTVLFTALEQLLCNSLRAIRREALEEIRDALLSFVGLQSRLPNKCLFDTHVASHLIGESGDETQFRYKSHDDTVPRISTSSDD